MSAESSPDRNQEFEGVSLRDVIDTDAVGDTVLFVGPAMTGKQPMAVDLLGAVTRAYGHPFAVTTMDTPEQLRTLYRRQVSAADDLRELVVIECLPENRTHDDERVYAAGSPGDLSGIARAVADAFENTPGREQDGPRLLINDISTLLLYANIETVTRFVHALMGRVTTQNGVLVATLDTDGISETERQTMTRLFETVIEVRAVDGATELRAESGPDGWQRLGTHGGED